MNAIRNQAWLIPLVISILLLTGFLGYFLKNEYEQEKEAIKLESRDAAFVNLFSNIRGAGPVEWKKDSFGNEILIRLEAHVDSNAYSYNYSFTDSTEILAEATEIKTIHHRPFNVSSDSTEILAEATEIKTINHRPLNVSSDSILTTITGRRKTAPGKLKTFEFSNSTTSEHDTLVYVEMIGTEEDGSDLPIFLRKEPNFKTMDILLRIWPQITFAILLLGSVILAYFMIAASLRKERQLSTIRNDFMSNMSHELKTPVSTISVALEALSNFNAADDKVMRKEYIDISKTEVERLGLLVDKALNISLFEQGKFIYDKQVFDLDIEITKVLSTLKVQLDNQQATLNYLSSGEDFHLYGDKTHIINVVHNLIENAIKYSDTHPVIDIKLSEINDSLQLTTSDQGQGIAPQYQNKIFDKFFRVPQGDIHNVKGHGLGLSYVQQVISKHHGTIKVYSVAGEGTTFIITIPKSIPATNGATS